jgi:hypothetical protein
MITSNNMIFLLHAKIYNNNFKGNKKYTFKSKRKINKTNLTKINKLNKNNLVIFWQILILSVELIKELKIKIKNVNNNNSSLTAPEDKNINSNNLP